jgi:hypothetical protein
MFFHGVSVCDTFMTLATLRVRYLSVEFWCVTCGVFDLVAMLTSLLSMGMPDLGR